MKDSIDNNAKSHFPLEGKSAKQGQSPKLRRLGENYNIEDGVNNTPNQTNTEQVPIGLTSPQGGSERCERRSFFQIQEGLNGEKQNQPKKTENFLADFLHIGLN